MWYFLIKYSFDGVRPVCGPFSIKEDAWKAASEDAQSEFEIDKANEFNTDMMVYEDSGDILLVNHFADRDDTTEWIVFEI